MLNTLIDSYDIETLDTVAYVNLQTVVFVPRDHYNDKSIAELKAYVDAKFEDIQVTDEIEEAIAKVHKVYELSSTNGLTVRNLKDIINDIENGASVYLASTDGVTRYSVDYVGEGRISSSRIVTASIHIYNLASGTYNLKILQYEFFPDNEDGMIITPTIASKTLVSTDKFGHGFKVDSGVGTIYLDSPTGALESRVSYPVLGSTMDVAWKMVATGGKIIFTDEEKTSVRELFGAVGDTDYASGGNAGVIKVNQWGFHGLSMIDNGQIAISSASNTDIDNATSVFKPIVANNYKYAVKKGITTNTEMLTDEEKQAVASWIGTQGQNKPNTLVQRYGSGNIAVPLVPTAEVHATSKKYVDGKYDELLARIEALENK